MAQYSLYSADVPLNPINQSSHISQSSLAAGSAAVRADDLKRVKYAELAASANYIFELVAIETLGTWGASALSICSEIGGRVATRTGDIRAFAFLKQRLSIAVQKGNAAAVIGTSPLGDVSLLGDPS